MNTDVMFSSKSDEWATPQDFYEQLDGEFGFTLDAAASADNYKYPCYLTRENDALGVEWRCMTGGAIWVNPPYSQIAKFVAKAASEAHAGATVVMLIPARPDTRYWAAHIWDHEQHRPRPGVQVRFIKGRLRFGGAPHSAPFPSAVVIFRPESSVSGDVERIR